MNRFKAYRKRLVSRLACNNDKEDKDPKLVEPSEHTKEAIGVAHKAMKGLVARHWIGEMYHNELKPKLDHRLSMDDPKGAADDIVEHLESYHPDTLRALRENKSVSRQERAVGKSIKGLHFAAHMNEIAGHQQEHESHGGFFPEEHY